jgi:error-prone DNA polymerase
LSLSRRGAASIGIVGEVADDIYAKIEAFANFGSMVSGFRPSSPTVYASAWLVTTYPGHFSRDCCALQPMASYAPLSLVADA